MPHRSEAGITNLGPLPPGMTLLDALRATRGERKYALNPERPAHRLTICDCLREIWRIGDSLGNDDLKELAEAGGDFAKRMDARMKELSGRKHA